MLWKYIKWGLVQVNQKKKKNIFRVEKPRTFPSYSSISYLILYGGEEVDQTPAIFCRYPFLLDLMSKISIFKYIANLTQVFHLLLMYIKCHVTLLVLSGGF